jgi:hypothetical protein
MDLKKPEMMLSLVNTVATAGTSIYFYNRLSKVDQENIENKAVITKISDICQDIESNTKKNVERTRDNMSDLSSRIKRLQESIDDIKIKLENQQECIDIITEHVRVNLKSEKDLSLPKFNKSERFREYNEGRSEQRSRYREKEEYSRPSRRRHDDEDDDFDPVREIEDERKNRRREIY